jgi:GT2 family glycosyltransferase
VLDQHHGQIVGGTVFGIGRGYIAFSDHFCHWITNLPGYSGPAPEPHVVSTNMTMTREIWERVGPFNEQLRSGEDVDLCFHATSLGIGLWLTDELRIGHHDRERLSDYFANYYFCGTYRHYFYGRYSKLKRWVTGGSRLTRALLVPAVTTALIARYLIGFWRYDKRIVLALPGVGIACLAMALGLAAGLPKQPSVAVDSEEHLA